MPAPPPPGRTWTANEIAADCAIAKAQFRTKRLAEPLHDYLAAIPIAEAAAASVIDNLQTVLAVPSDPDVFCGLLSDDATFAALRYLTAVPISEDDLDTLLGAKLSRTALRREPGLADALATLLRDNLDPKRFPWVIENRSPNPCEVHAAKLATATATAIQRVHTKRRGDEKQELETDLEAILNAAGFTFVQRPATNITVLSNGPSPGAYMKECNLGADNADFVVGLRNGRFLALEAKASNSEINSRKRLNKEVAQDAQHWARDFGAQVVAAAGLRGVFKPAYVADAQDTPLLVFWGHRLSDLSDYLAAAT